MPGEKLPDSSEVLLDIIKKYDKSLGREELEEKYLKLMNHHSLNNLGIKIWNHESFENSLNQLFYENKIKVLKFPWKSKCSVK